MRVRELAQWLGAEFEGDGEVDITGVAAIESAGPADVSFINSRKAAQQAQASSAGCLIVPKEFDIQGRAIIRAASPRSAFARAIGRLHPPRLPDPGIDLTAEIASGTQIAAGVSIGPHASIGKGTIIGSDTVVGAGTRIGRGVVIGDGGLLHANVTIYDDV